MSASGPWSGLLGRRRECERLGSLVAAAKAGRSQVLVLRGEAGIGKTALLEFLLAHAGSCRVGRAAGVQSETELPYAGLHQLCGPYLERLDRLPAPQRDGLGTAFGLRPGTAPGCLLVGPALLTLLGEVAAEQPLLWVVDDAQWLDQASAEALEFAARRLVAQPVAMVFAAREAGAGGILTGLPELVVPGLDPSDAAALLDTAVTGTFDPRVRNRILAESHGNPLALSLVPRALSAAELAFGGAADSRATPPIHRLEQDFLRDVAPLPEPSRRLLLAAAAEPLGDVSLLWRAADRLGISTDAADAAAAAGLIEFRDGVRFRHPLARSAVYRSASPAHRRQVHEALAAVTDPHADPDRRAWHRARAAVGPDEVIAADLERSADRALTRGGLAAAAAFLDEAAALTSDPARRAERSLNGAQAKVNAGAFDDARALLAAAQGGPLPEADRARADLLRARISAANRDDEALPLFLAVARRLEQLDPRCARDAYLDAFSAALFAGRPGPGPGARQVAEAVRQAPPAATPGNGDALLEGFAVLFTEGYASAAPLSHRALQSFLNQELSIDERLRLSWPAASTAASLWNDGGWDVLTRRHLQAAREAGALGVLPLALTSRLFVHLFTGDLTGAAGVVEQMRSGAEGPTGVTNLATYGEACLAAVRGHDDVAGPLIRESLEDLAARGESFGVNVLQWARAILCNGVGRYREALTAARRATVDPVEPGPPRWALAELVEAAVHTGEAGTAAAAFERLCPMTQASGTEWARGIDASRRALLLDGDRADELYREAVERLGRTTVRVDLARVQLLYGEWLRRGGRRVDARAQLRTAYESLSAMGLEAFADRARRELLATGETVRRRTVDTSGQLTAQEAHIAKLAVEGLTNSEIGAALYISSRTVEWHLRRIFTKLGVSTRRQLRLSLPD